MTTLAIELARCPIFGQLSENDLARVAAGCRSLVVRSGEFVFREGQECEGFYVVVSGGVRVFKISPDGRERTLHVVRAPLSFAEAAIFSSGGYPAFAAAVEDSRLIFVPREPFLRLLREEPHAAVRVFESLSQWLHRLVDQLETETFLNTRARLAHYLLKHARSRASGRGSCLVELREPKKDVASHLGMAPETFSRAQASLEERGLIRVMGRRIEVLDPDGLEQLVLGDMGAETA